MLMKKLCGKEDDDKPSKKDLLNAIMAFGNLLDFD